MPQCLRVLTLNCWNVSEPYAARMAVARAAIAELAPALIGLQEVVVRRDGFDQAADLLGGLGYHSVYAPAFRWTESGHVAADDAGDGFGNVIASRWPIAARERRALPGAELDERRCAVAAHVEAPFGRIPFVCTHLAWRFAHGALRERQVRVLDQLARDWTRDASFPPIVVGDLNADPDATEIRFLCGLASLEGHSTYYQDAWRVRGGGPGFTWDNRNANAALMFEPDRRIDYVLVGLGDATGRGWIERVALACTEPVDGVWASDHFGVVADIRL
ncbi:MAG: endonuclease/exonuclease/phosphatase family protein [Candidatus Binatia bacterium]